MYTALEVAKYTINKCIELGRPISNLQLQKILYYIQGEYMKKNHGEVLFNESIEAWQYGPVVPDVYYKYKMYSASRIIDKQEEIEITASNKPIIDEVIENKSLLRASRLVQDTHEESPWKTAYKRGSGTTILKEEMKEFFFGE